MRFAPTYKPNLTENWVLHSLCITLFYLQHVLQFNYNVHVHTLVILPIFNISVWQIPIAVNTVLKLLTMDSKSLRNTWSSLPNKVEKQCTPLAFIIRAAKSVFVTCDACLASEGNHFHNLH